jgi:uncharacterized glyoxalase superfamily protein PhnB
MIVNRSAPTATIVPVLVYDDVEQAIRFMVDALGFVEHLRAHGQDGRVNHAQLKFGDGAVIIGRQGGPFKIPASSAVSHMVHVSIDGVDAHYERASRHGANILEAPHDMPFGVRQYTIQDTGGHWWTFSQNIADVAPAEWGAVEAH